MLFSLNFMPKRSVEVCSLLTVFLVANAISQGTAQELEDQKTDLDGGIEVPIGKGLVELTKETFYDHITNGTHFVKFYEPWCGHSYRFAPTWKKLAESPDAQDISVSKFDCAADHEICQKFDIKSYPSLIWIENGEKVGKFSGDRTQILLSNYIQKMLNTTNGTPDVS